MYEEIWKINPAKYTAALCSGAAAQRSVREVNIHPNDMAIILGVACVIGHLSGLILKKIA